MISSFFKKGFGGAVGIATLSLISAGMLGTNMYNDGSNKDNALHEANQLINYVNAISTRLNLDGGVVWEDEDAINGTQSKGSFWKNKSAFLSKTLFPPPNPESTNPKLIKLKFSDTRHLFTSIDSQCTNHSEVGTWGESPKPRYQIPNHLIACNAYRIKDPFKNTIYLSNGTEMDKDAVAVVIHYKLNHLDTPREVSIQRFTISIPLTNYINYSKKATIKAIREVANKLPSSAEVFISRGGDQGSAKLSAIQSPSDPQHSEVYGTSASVIFGNKCDNTNGKQCYLNIIIRPIKSSGCDDCLKTDGSNSMKAAITFDNQPASFSGPLLAWNTTPAFIETPTATQVNSGFIADGGDLILKLDADSTFIVEQNLEVKQNLEVEKNLEVLQTINGLFLRKINNSIVVGTTDNQPQGTNNTALGAHSLSEGNTGSYNTAVGEQSLGFSNEGNNNTAIGYNTLFLANTGNKNTALGGHSLSYNKSGSSNVSAGYEAMKSNTSGNYNTAIGTEVMKSNTSGNNNTAIGMYALSSNTTNSGNTAIGYAALEFSTGENNIGVGSSAGANTNGSDNINIGNNTDSKTLTGTFQLNIGDTLYGNLTKKEIGIGKFPSYPLDVKGDINTDSGYLVNGTKLQFPKLHLQNIKLTPPYSKVSKPTCPTGSYPAIFTIPVAVASQVVTLPYSVPAAGVWGIYPQSYGTYWRIHQTGWILPGSKPIVYSMIYCDSR